MSLDNVTSFSRIKNLRNTFLTYETEFVFSGAGKCYLAQGPRQLTRDAKSEASSFQTTLTRRNEKLRMTFGVGRQTT